MKKPGIQGGAANHPEAALIDRLRGRLTELGKSARAACVDAGLQPDYLKDLFDASTRSPTVDSMRKLAPALNWTLGELLGLSAPTTGGGLDPAILRQVIVAIDDYVARERLVLPAETRVNLYLAAYDVARKSGEFDPREHRSLIELARRR